MTAWTALPALASTDPFDKPVYDAIKGDLEYLHGDAVWTPFTFQNSWADFAGAGYPPAGYRRIGDFTLLRGAIKNGTTNTVAFTLPVGYRPPFFYPISALGANAAAGYLISANTDGTVQVTCASNGFVGLNNIWIPLA